MTTTCTSYKPLEKRYELQVWLKFKLSLNEVVQVVMFKLYDETSSALTKQNHQHVIELEPRLEPGIVSWIDVPHVVDNMVYSIFLVFRCFQHVHLLSSDV